MNTKRKRFACATLHGKIYVFGGANPKRLNDGEVFDPDTKQWTVLPNMKHARVGCSCVAIGDNIYVTGGLTENGKNSMTGEVFDTTTNTWSPMAEMAVARDRHGASVAIGNDIYVMGGHRCHRKVEVYNTLTKKWSGKAPMKVMRYGFDAVVHNEKIYAIGGMTEFKTNCNTGREYGRFLETMEV